MMSVYALKQPVPEELKEKYISGFKLKTLRSLYTLIWSHLNISDSSFGNIGKLSCVIKFFKNKNHSKFIKTQKALLKTRYFTGASYLAGLFSR